MTQLSQVNTNSVCRVLSIEADNALKERLKSFGVKKGALVTVKDFSINKKTLSIKVGSTVLALREDEAKKIEVEVE